MWSLGMVIACMGAPALAQEEPAPKQEAEEREASPSSRLTPDQRIELLGLLQQAEKAYNAGAFGEALSAYEQAYGILPMPDILFRIALCLDKAERLESAREKYSLYIAVAPGSTRQGQAQARLENIEARIAASRRATVQLTVEPPDAVVVVDGAALEERTLKIEGIESPRTLTLGASAPDHEPQELVVEVEGGRDYQFTLSLAPIPETVVVQEVDRPASALLVAGALTASASIGLLVANAVTHRQVRQEVEACVSTSEVECPFEASAGRSIRDELDAKRARGNAFGISAIGTGVASVSLFYLAARRRSGGGGADEVGWRVRPAPNGLQVIGRW